MSAAGGVAVRPGADRSYLARLRASLPRGGLLPRDIWATRHRAITVLLAAHAVVIAAVVLTKDFDPLHALLEGSAVAVAAAIAANGRLARRERAVAASAGLLTASAILVHLSGGFIEMHFHFFVMIIVISLYQEWWPFLIAIGYVVVHHGLVGTIDPDSVYNHPAAIADPWLWASVHGGFVLAASVAAMIAWRLNEELMWHRLAAEHRAREAAEAAVRTREQFLSIATHELRTPVTSIKGYAQLALRSLHGGGASTERLERALRTLDGQTDRLARLITQLLDVNVIEAGRLELARVRSDLGLLVERAVEEARNRGVERHDWVVRIAEGVELEIDAGRIEQVVTNLLENAVRYSPDGGTIRVELDRDPAGARLTVADEGIGIPTEARGRIFERFFQAHADRNYGGMGLGLYIAREIVERHGGSIAAAPNGSRGTVFTVVLPARMGERASAPPATAADATRAAPAAARAATIWAIEDDRDIRELIRAVLGDAGYDVRAFEDGERALGAFDAARSAGAPQPALLVLDKLMPVMGGTEFARALRERPGPYPRLLGLCAARDAAEWARSIGADGYVAKPFDTETLVAEVGRLIAEPARA